MIKVLCETMTNSYDSSWKVRTMVYDSIEDFKKEVLKHYPKIKTSLSRENEDLWFGIQYGSTSDGFWFRWLYAIVDTNRGCLYSIGNDYCTNELGLPKGKKHCSNEIYTMLKEIDDEITKRKNDIVFVD